MKRKILAIFMVFMILFTNYAFAAMNYNRPTDGSSVIGILDNDHKFGSNSEIYLDNKYSATTLGVPYTSIKIYKYNQNPTPSDTSGTPINVKTSSTTNKKEFYLWPGWDKNQIFYGINLNNSEEISNVATIIYKNAIEYTGKKYDLKLNIKSIKTQGCNSPVFGVKIANTEKTDVRVADKDLYNPSKYGHPTPPHLRMEPGNSGHAEVDVEYIILNPTTGSEVKVSGLYQVIDVDLQQGVCLKDYKLTSDNAYANKDLDSSVKYKILNNSDTYIYSTTDRNLDSNISSVYALLDGKNKIEQTYTWDGLTAASNVMFNRPEQIKVYHKITTAVEHGTIDPGVSNLIDDARKEIKYSPDENYKLKSVTVDGKSVDISKYPTSYTFEKIREDHDIKVVYDKIQWKVTFDSKGGAPTPDTQTVENKGKATKPSNPTKDGYEFKHWVKKGTSDVYDFNSEVTSNVDLEAVWTPIQYKINYVLNLDGAKNDPSNPSTYKKTDDISFKNAISPDSDKYTFLGWYEDANFTKKIDGISNRTGDVTVYAKWKEEKEPEPTPEPEPENAKYKVEHYKETEDGKYELVSSDTLTGEVDSTVTATPNTYTGYKENTTHKDRVQSGKVAADDSLVLKLYYDKIKYTVTFEPKNDTDIPDQIVPYMDKAVEPNVPIKEGYTFRYWYYINENNQKVAYNFDDPVTSDVDLIAEWEKVEEPEEPTNNNVVPKTDDSTTPKTEAKTELPKTGHIKKSILAIILIVVAGVFFGIKYGRIKNMLK